MELLPQFLQQKQEIATAVPAFPSFDPTAELLTDYIGRLYPFIAANLTNQQPTLYKQLLFDKQINIERAPATMKSNNRPLIALSVSTSFPSLSSSCCWISMKWSKHPLFWFLSKESCKIYDQNITFALTTDKISALELIYLFYVFYLLYLFYLIQLF